MKLIFLGVSKMSKYNRFGEGVVQPQGDNVAEDRKNFEMSKTAKLKTIQQKADALLLAIVEAYPCMTEEVGTFARRSLAKEMTRQEACNLFELFSITSRVALNGFDVSRSLVDTENHSTAYSKFHQNSACSQEQ